MIRFAGLFEAIDRTTSTNGKVEALAEYFRSVPAEDGAWAVYFLTGRRLKRLASYVAIRDWTLAATGFEEWLLQECYAVVGDGAETSALMLDQLPTSPAADVPLSRWLEDRILPLRQLDPAARQARVTGWFGTLDRLQRFILLKLLTGELRVGVSQTLVVRALSIASGLPAPAIAARLMGDWTPSGEWFASLLSPEATDDDRSRPYPFFLAPRSRPPSRRWGTSPAGWSNGSGTAFARSSSDAAGRSICGRAARS